MVVRGSAIFQRLHAAAVLHSHQILRQMLQCFGPALDMVVSSRDGLEDRLMQSQLGSAPLVRKGCRNHRSMERALGVIFESIGEDKPLWLDDLLIYASLSLYDPLVFLCGNVTAA